MLTSFVLANLLLSMPALASSPPSRQITITVCGRPLASVMYGRLDKELIRRVIRGHRNELRACYERGLIQRPNLRGRVMVSFLVLASGQVEAVQVEAPPSFEAPPREPPRPLCHPELEAPDGPLASPIAERTPSQAAWSPSDDVGQCISAAVSRWRFPAYTGGVVTEVHYPVVFGPSEPVAETAQVSPAASEYFSEEELARLSAPSCNQ